MPPDRERVTACREWLTIAASDLRAALHLRQAEPPLIDHSLYHRQQCTEKVLKAFLLWHEVAFRKTHNLEELGLQCTVIDPALASLIDDVVGLTSYGWMYRYPSLTEFQPTLEDADIAYRTASEAMRLVLAKLPADAAP
jgi:HEPN domain-containing protein